MIFLIIYLVVAVVVFNIADLWQNGFFDSNRTMWDDVLENDSYEIFKDFSLPIASMWPVVIPIIFAILTLKLVSDAFLAAAKRIRPAR